MLWYTGQLHQAAIEATDARFTPTVAAFHEDHSFDERFRFGKALRGLAAFKFGLKHVFLDEVPQQINDLNHILRTFPADVLLVDTGFFGAGLLHELGGPRWATYGITALTLNSRDTAPFGMGLLPGTSPVTRLRNQLLSALTDRVLFRDVQRYLQQIRTQLGLPRNGASMLNVTLSPYLYLQGSTPAFEYPRREIAPQVHFIGPLLPTTPHTFTPPAWWPELHQNKPVVLVNQGTVATKLDDLIVPTLRALADQQVLVIATTGGAPIEQLGIDLPGNAHVEPFVPFGALLPHVDIMITNGGYGGVQFALTHGVPLVVAGTTEEKPEIAARVAWSGAGINLKTKSPTPEQIRAAVQAIQADPRYRHHAQRIQADYGRHNPANEAATLLEQLALTGQPVLRTVPLPEHTSRSATTAQG